MGIEVLGKFFNSNTKGGDGLCEELRGSVYRDKSSTSQSLRQYGVKPHFYREQDVEYFTRVTGLLTPNISINPDTIHTVFPPLDLQPLDNPNRYAEEYGVVRLGLFQFLVRPNLKNVKSCHAVTKDNDNTPAGNLGYINNPFWTCYGVYKNKHSRAEIVCPIGDGFTNSMLGDLPNIVATVNALLCYNIKGEPSVLLTRVYGDAKITDGLLRLVEYFTYRCGVHVYVHDAYAKDGYTEDTKDEHVYGSLYNKKNTFTLFSPPVPSQIALPETSTYGDIPSRYSDIDPQLCQVQKNRLPLVAERHSGYLFMKSTHKIDGIALPMAPNTSKNLRDTLDTFDTEPSEAEFWYED